MRVGQIAYACEQGLGYLAKSFHDAGIIDSTWIVRHPHGEDERPTQLEWYPQGTPVGDRRSFATHAAFDQFLSRIDVLLCYETPFDWNAIRICREKGVKTVLIPMYEWYPERAPYKFDSMIFPSLLDQDYFRSQYPQAPFIPIPADPAFEWTERKTIRKFLHNAGHVGSRNHKGTLELLKAIPMTTAPFQMTIRCQDARLLRSLIDLVPEVKTDARVQFIFGPRPREELFNGFDAYVAPEKYNGLSLPLQEAFQSGLVVLTTDRYPVNTWLPNSPLIPHSGTQRVRAAAGHLEIDESVVDPRAIATALDYWYDKDATGLSAMGLGWSTKNSWDVLRPKYLAELERVVGK